MKIRYVVRANHAILKYVWSIIDDSDLGAEVIKLVVLGYEIDLVYEYTPENYNKYERNLK